MGTEEGVNALMHFCFLRKHMTQCEGMSYGTKHECQW